MKKIIPGILLLFPSAWLFRELMWLKSAFNGSSIEYRIFGKILSVSSGFWIVGTEMVSYLIFVVVLSLYLRKTERDGNEF